MGFWSKLFGSNKGAAQQQADQARKEADAARAAAEAQQAVVSATKAQQEQALMNLQSNSQALSNANAANTQGVVANVVAGGLADQVDTVNRKRRASSGIASTLGLNL